MREERKEVLQAEEQVIFYTALMKQGFMDHLSGRREGVSLYSFVSKAIFFLLLHIATVLKV